MKQSEAEKILNQILNRLDGLSQFRSMQTVKQSINASGRSTVIQAGRDVYGDIVVNYNNDLSFKEKRLIDLLRAKDSKEEQLLKMICALETLE